MSLNEKTKAELCEITYDQSCCKLAALSAFVRTAGSIVSENRNYGLTLSAPANCAEYYGGLMQDLFNARPVYNVGKSGITGFTVLNENSLSILVELGIIRVDDNQLTLVIEPEDYLVENECCKRAYVRGAFMGSGSLTVPDVKVKSTTTGYHLEFVFSNYLTALHFCNLLGSVNFLPKLIERKGNYIVYFKQHEEIKDILFAI